MTYRYDINLADDVSKIRFHVGDNNDKGHYLENETIQYLVTTYGIGLAVLRSIEYIITQLSQPGFSLGWMNVTNADARKGYENLLKIKAQEFSLNVSGAVMTSSVAMPYRADSYMTDGVQDGAP